MQKLLTERLILLPLTKKQFYNYIFHLVLLEKELNIKYEGVKPSGTFYDALQKRYLKFLSCPRQPFFHTLWLICLADGKTVIGNIAYKGLPDDNGVIEIAYSLGEKYRGQGYMTEAVTYFTNYALKLPGVHSIVAVTEYTNNKSIKVLQNSNFFYTGSNKIYLYWTKSTI